MSSSIYTNSESESSSIYANRNNITIAYALLGKNLTKIIYQDGSEKAYDNAYYYKFFNRDVYGLNDILPLVKYLLHRPQCCVIRGVCKDDSLVKQRRLYHGDEATIIEQPQNWYALDIDGYGECSGDLKTDAKSVLLALNMPDTEAFAIPSAGYLRKPGIKIRLFLWNNTKVSCYSLKKHFDQYKHIADPALFSPVQPIYIARPIFNGMSDPCNNQIVWIYGNTQCTEIREVWTPGRRSEILITKKRAEINVKSILRRLFEVDNNRHDWLRDEAATPIGQWIAQGLLDEHEMIDELYLATAIWRGDRKRDMDTILWGIRRGKEQMEK